MVQQCGGGDGDDVPISGATEIILSRTPNGEKLGFQDCVMWLHLGWLLQQHPVLFKVCHLEERDGHKLLCQRMDLRYLDLVPLKVQACLGE